MYQGGETLNRFFIITIDTEGDNLWAHKDIKTPVSTENSKYIERFQLLCEKYGFVVTYLTNYEMAMEKVFVDIGEEGLRRKTIEIGAHEHAWNSPPYFPLIKSPFYRGKPYLSEYPLLVVRRKLEYITKTLEDVFQCKITSHRGGKWCLNKTIARELLRLGYISDCTVTPRLSWQSTPGWSIMAGRTGGPDFRNNPNCPHILCEDREGKKIIEIPATLVSKTDNTVPAWFRPNGRNVETMLGMIDYIYESEVDYIEFMLHSSELMPGGSPTFRNVGQIEVLYENLIEIFEKLKSKGYTGIGLSEYSKIKLEEMGE